MDKDDRAMEVLIVVAARFGCFGVGSVKRDDARLLI